MAEASSTILFTFGGLAAFREQLVHQRCAGLYELPGAALSPLNAALLSRDAQFVVFDAQHNLISNPDAERFPKGRRDHDAAILVHSRSGFFCHGKPQFQ
jgi:hypothetical protein